MPESRQPDDYTPAEAVLAEFLDRTDKGEKLSREEFFASHPEIADELRGYFEDLETVGLALAETQGGTEKIEESGDDEAQFPRDFGAYVLLSRIGAGGMGEVFKAQHRHMERIVAIKTLHGQTLDSPEAIRRFHREVKATAKLSHSNIVTAHDAGEVEGVHFLAMEYVEGQDLHSFVAKRGPVKVASAVKIILQAARGLEFAHQQGVIHRDVKPANLLLAKDRTVKLLDLGLARQDTPVAENDVTGEASLTREGQIMGTVDYMAPEQAADTRQAGVAADIYGLGCTLHFLLTGRSVYLGETMMKRLIAHREQPIPSLCERRQSVPSALDAVFQKMVAKKPEDRQASMTEAIAELEQALAAPDSAAPTTATHEATVDHVPDSLTDAPPSDPEAPALTQPAIAIGGATQAGSLPTIRPIATPQSSRRKPPNRNLLIAAGGLFGLVLLASVIVISIRTPKGWLVIKVEQSAARISIDGDEVKITPEGNPEPIKVKVTEGPHKLEITKGGFVTYAEEFKIVSGEETPVHVRLEPLSGEPADATAKHPVAVSIGQPVDRPEIVSVTIDPEPVQLQPGSPVASRALVLDPDSIEGAHAWTLETIHHRGAVTSVAYSPDGKLLATGCADAAARLWNVKSGKLVKVFLGDDGVGGVAFSPDGRYLAVGRNDVRIREVESGRLVRSLTDHEDPVTDVAFSPDGRLLGTSSRDATIRLIDLASGETRHVFAEHTDRINGFAWSPDGTRLASVSQDKTLRIWDSKLGTLVRTFETSFAADVAWLPDNKTVATSLVHAHHRGESVALWDPDAAELKMETAVNTEGVAAIAISPDGTKLVGGSGKFASKTQAWDLLNGETLAEWEKGSKLAANAAAFSPDGRSCALGIADGTVQIVGIPTGEVLQTLASHGAGLTSASFSPDNTKLAIGLSPTSLQIWDVASGTLLQQQEEKGTGAGALQWSPDGRTIAFGSAPLPGVFTWNPQASEMKCFAKDAGVVGYAAWSSDGKLLAAGGNRLLLHDAHTGEILHTLPGYGNGVAFSPDNKLLAFGADQRVKLCEVETAEVLHEVDLGGWINATAFSPDGRIFAAAGYAESIGLWEVESGRPVGSINDLEYGRIDWLRFSDDGKQLLGGYWGHLYAWDVQSGKRIRTLEGNSPAVSPDLKTVVMFGNGFFRLRSIDDGSTFLTVLCLRNQQSARIGPGGHIQGSLGVERELVHVVQDMEGRQVTLTPDEFTKQYGWENNPAKVTGSRPKDNRPPTAESVPNAAPDSQSQL